MRGLVETEKSVSTENLKDYSGKFVYNSSQFNANVHEINKAFTSEYSNFQLAYSIKSNYSKSLLNDAANVGLWLEVASFNEVDKAISIPHETQLILTCPFIGNALLSKAFENNIIINVDSIEQLTRLAESDLAIRVSLRLNFSVEGLEHSRFGIGYSKENIGLISEIASRAKLQLVGVHCHFTTKGRTIKSFEQRAQKLAEAFKVFRHFGSLEYINIGGGFFGKMPNDLRSQIKQEVPSFKQYAVAISGVLNREFEDNTSKPKLIIEPGAALSANCFRFVAQVLEIKKGVQKNYAVLNTSNVWLKPTKHALDLSFEVHNLNFSPPSTYTLVANNCMENDILGTYNGELNTGDFVVFNNVGAYASSFGSEFIVGKALTVDLD